MRTFTIVPSFDGNSAYFELPDLGFQGDHLSFAILFNLTELTEHWPNILPSMIVSDPAGNTFLAPNTSWDADKHLFTWNITSVETAHHGEVKCQLRCTAADDPDTIVCMSQRCQTKVYESLAAADNPPEAFQMWLDTLALLGAQATADMNEAIAAAEVSETNARTAQDAATDAEAAKDAAETASASARTSASTATTAAESASASQTRATNAAGAAETARDRAEAAQRTAETALEEMDQNVEAIRLASQIASTSADRAEAAEANAATSKTQAESARDAAIAAKGQAEQAEARINATESDIANAEARINQKEADAQSAKTAAIAAQTAAENARDAAEDAQDAAELAQSGTEQLKRDVTALKDETLGYKNAASRAITDITALKNDVTTLKGQIDTAADTVADNLADTNTAKTQAQAAQSAAETAQGLSEDSAEEAKKWAVGKDKNGTDVPSSDPTYRNSAKHWAEESGSHVEGAKKWATGTDASGNPVASTDPTYENSAKHWAEESGSHVEAAKKWATGLDENDDPVASTDPTYLNSAKHWAEESADSMEESRKWATGRNTDDVPVSAMDPAHNNNAWYWSTVSEDQAEASKKWAIGKTRTGADVPASDLTSQNSAKYWSEQSASFVEFAKRWATGTNNDDTPVASTDPTHENSAKYWSEQSDASAEQAKKWAIGKDASGADVDAEDDTHQNSAKYYAEQAHVEFINAQSAGRPYRFGGTFTNTNGQTGTVLITDSVINDHMVPRMHYSDGGFLRDRVRIAVGIGTVSLQYISTGTCTFDLYLEEMNNPESIPNDHVYYDTPPARATDLADLDTRIGNMEAPANVFVDIPFTIAASDWAAISSANTNVSPLTSGYRAEIRNAALTETCGVWVFYDANYQAVARAPITTQVFEVVSEPATYALVFATSSAPTSAISGFIRIVDSVNGVVPISRGGTGATTAAGARQSINAADATLVAHLSDDVENLTPLYFESTITGTSFDTVTTFTVTDSAIEDTMIPEIMFGSDTSVLNGTIDVNVGPGTLTYSLRLNGTILIRCKLQNVRRQS